MKKLKLGSALPKFRQSMPGKKMQVLVDPKRRKRNRKPAKGKAIKKSI